MILHRITIAEGDMYEIPAYEDARKRMVLLPNPKSYNEDKLLYNFPKDFEEMQSEGVEWVGTTRYNENIYSYKDLYFKYILEYWEGKQGKVKKSVLQSFEVGTLICKCDCCGTLYSVEIPEMIWFEKKGLTPPTRRCHFCRKQKRRGIKRA